LEPIRVVYREPAPWRGRLALALILMLAAWGFAVWNSTWERVIPGMPGSELNAAVAAMTESRMQRSAAHAPVTDTLLAVAAQPIGEPVLLQRAGVRWTSGEGAFWVSQVGTPAVFVSGGDVETGRAVDIEGKVEAVPPREEIKRRWPGLREEDLERLARQGVYIQAERVSVAGWF
jgi:hypothetical protein